MAKPEQVLDAAQERVVVVRRVVDRSRFDERRDQHRSRAPAAEPEYPRQRSVRPDGLVAAGTRVELAAAGLRLVEEDGEQTVLLEGLGLDDRRDPLLEEGIGRDQTPRLPLDPRGLVRG